MYCIVPRIIYHIKHIENCSKSSHFTNALREKKIKLDTYITHILLSTHHPQHTTNKQWLNAVGSTIGGFNSLPPAPGLSGLLGVSYSPSPGTHSSGSLPRRRGPSGPIDDLSMTFLGGITPFAPTITLANSPMVRIH